MTSFRYTKEAEHERIVAAARMGGITDTPMARVHFSEQRATAAVQRLGAWLCAACATFVIWGLYELVKFAWFS